MSCGRVGVLTTCMYITILPVVHLVTSLEDPEHGAPPLQGAGLLHCLVLFIFPVFEVQELQDPHKLHPPFTPWLPIYKHLLAIRTHIAGSNAIYM